MIYTPRSQSIEAAPVELAGQRLMAVAVDGKAHLVDAGVFETLFHQEEATQKIERLERVVASETRRPKPTPKPKRVTPSPKQAAPGDGTRAGKCIQILREHGPLTSTELRERIFDDLPKDKHAINFSDLSIRMRRTNQIERRTDPRTQLDKWHIVEASDGKL